MRQASTGSGHHDESRPNPGHGLADELAAVVAAACGGAMDAASVLDSLHAVRLLGTELERGELALIEAARSAGVTWAQVATVMGARNRQTAQKRHADLALRCPRPPVVDTARLQPQPPTANATMLAGGRVLPKSTPKAPPNPGAAGQAAPHAPARRSPAIPRITSDIIREARYELARARDHAETRAWHVMVSGRTVGLVRPTWRGERSRPGWEPLTITGTVLAVRGTGRVTPAGNARTRDAAAVSLLRALQHQQQERKNSADGTAGKGGA